MGWNIAVVGANGMAGREVLKCLAERRFPCGEVVALAEGVTQGKAVSFGDDDLQLQPVEEFDFDGVQLVFFAGDPGLAVRHAGTAIAAGAAVIDGTGHFAHDSKVPLVVPSVNPEALAGFARSHVVASPSPAAVFLATVFAPLDAHADLRQLVVTCLVPASAAGTPGMDELFAQTRAVFMNSRMQGEMFPRQLAFNLFPQVGEFGHDGRTSAESGLVAECQRLLGPDVRIGATCVQVPVFLGEALSVSAGFAGSLTPGSARKLLAHAEGVAVLDNPGEGVYAMPVECVGEDEVFVSRLRKDEALENGLSLFVVGDNARIGGALNMVQIAESIAGMGDS